MQSSFIFPICIRVIMWWLVNSNLPPLYPPEYGKGEVRDDDDELVRVASHGGEGGCRPAGTGSGGVGGRSEGTGALGKRYRRPELSTPPAKTLR